MEVYLTVQALLGVLLFSALIRGRNSLLWVSGFLIPLYGMSAFVGVRLTWDKLIPVALALDLLIRGGSGRLLHMPGRGPLLVLLTYATILSWVTWAFDTDAEQWRYVAIGMGWGAGQTTYRYLVQGAVFLQTWTVPILAFCIVQSRTAFQSASRGFVWGTSVSVGAGIYQAFARPLGLPWWDSSVGDIAQGSLGVRERVQQFSIGPFSVDRLYGLGGEPKHTAALTLLALCLIFALFSHGERARGRFLVICLLLLGLVLTFSTSGWVACLAFFVVVLVRGKGGGAVRFVVAIGVLVGAILLITGPSAIVDLYDQRVHSRLYGERSVLDQEYKDGAFLAYIQDRPTRALVGHGVGGVDFFLIPYVDQIVLQTASSITPTYFLPRMIGDVGLVGTCLALLIVARWWAVSARLKSEGLGLFLVSGAVVLLLTPQTVLFAYLFLAGCYLGWSTSRVVVSRSASVQASPLRDTSIVRGANVVAGGA